MRYVLDISHTLVSILINALVRSKKTNFEFFDKSTHSDSSCNQMLSTQTLETLPGRHQRQNSTPTVIETYRNLLHRRGLSLDYPGTNQRHHGLPQQYDHQPNVEYIQGQRLTPAAPTQEAPQQQPMARPGHGPETNQNIMQQIIQDEALRAGQEFPRQEREPKQYDSHFDFSAPSLLKYLPQALPRQERNPEATYNNCYTASLVDHEQKPAGSLQDEYGNTHAEQQPCTPPSQTRMCWSQRQSLASHMKTANISPGYFPLTPATTPFSQHPSTSRSGQTRTAEASPTRRDPNLTIKASHEMQRGISYQDNFTALRQLAINSEIPSPPNTAPLEPRRSLDLAAFPPPSSFNMSSLQMDIPLWNDGFDSSNYSPMSNAISSAASSFQSSPEMTHMPLFGEIQDSAMETLLSSNVAAMPAPQIVSGQESPLSPVKHDLQEVPQSDCTNNDSNEGGEGNGFTEEEIFSFMQYSGFTGRWTCIYRQCGKTFGRKENIKSHIQTHLDDRQFRCKDCEKRFVRQHDLKRHANIHSGVRSYPCPCGKLFARMDALTRHRQRGMCIGAFEGTPKKVVKRGRPKKTRPETEERLEKSAATRQRALEKLMARSPTKAASISSSSESSHPSPEPIFDEMEFNDLSPLLNFTPAGSPGYSTGNRASESGSRKSSPSVSGTLPELDISSSPPAASGFFDFEASSESNTSDSLPVPFIGCQDFDLLSSPSKQESVMDTGGPTIADIFSPSPRGTEYAAVLTGSFDSTFTNDAQWHNDIL